MMIDDDICEYLGKNINCEVEVEKIIQKPVWPEGDGILYIYDDYQPLFTSATWSVTAKLNGKIITNTIPATKPHDPRFIKKWAQYLIRNKKDWLREVGVNVFEEYTKWGGNVEDLKDSLLKERYT